MTRLFKLPHCNFWERRMHGEIKTPQGIFFYLYTQKNLTKELNFDKHQKENRT